MDTLILEALKTYGLAGGFLIVSFWAMREIVRYFIRFTETQQTTIKEMTDEFTNTINNHLAHHTEAALRLDETIKQNTDATRSLMAFCAGSVPGRFKK